MDQDITPAKVDKARARRYGRRVLAVRAMAGETAWLEGRIIWHEGRVAWQTDRGITVPDVATIALAQRRLAQIGGFPLSSKKAFGNAEAWLARRVSKLELAKKLQGIFEPDIEGLAGKVRSSERGAAGRMAALLSAEAYCVNTLPISPGETLVASGGAAADSLRALVVDHEVPQAGRALAAMALGAIDRRHFDGKEGKITEPEWCARTYAWGVRHGWPEDAPTMLWLLASKGGGGLAERLAKVERRGGRFLPESEELRALLTRGVDTERVVELCEACASMEPVAVRIMHYRDKLEGVSLHWRQEAAAKLQNERLPLVAELIDLTRKYAISTLDPGTVYDLARFATMMLDLGNYPVELADCTLVVLRSGLELPADKRAPFFELLIGQFRKLWPTERFAEIAQGGQRGLENWKNYWCRDQARSIAKVLAYTNDAGIVREAIELDVVSTLQYYWWKDTDRYQLFLRLVRRLEVKNRNWKLADTLNEFGDVRAARTALNPLISAMLGIKNPEARATLSEAILDALQYEKGPAKETAPRLARYVPHIARFIESEGVEKRFAWRATLSAMLLDKEVGDDAAEWLERLLGYLKEMGRRGELKESHEQPLRIALPFVTELAAGDPERFGALIRTSLAHTFDFEIEQIEKGVEVLKRFPALRDALARVFPLQPQHCVGLAVKMGFAARLGKDAYAPLGYLEGQNEPKALPEEWQELVREVPDAEVDARAYVMARGVLGEEAVVPPGVRKALEQPRKLAEELAFLEKRLGVHEGATSAGIEVRLENLRMRLANEGKMMREVRAEVEEKLAQASAEAQITAAEAKMKECYRVRLEKLAGALPANMEINDNLVNATLLTADIDSNRKLLLKLLKAYLRGDTRWHEHHAANVHFLTGLARRGVNTQVWLAANPKRYACKGVAGGRVRLLLERDPLGVLQMGNYFDTCLSFGQFNSFSTVANACELNKRVIYAYDGTGRVVGRKLIGISDKGDLVGFHTYSILGDEEGKALRGVFRRYCTDFAAKCGLKLADEGNVPTLFATRWYDDGTVEWSSDDDRRPTASNESASTSNTTNPPRFVRPSTISR